MIIILKSIKIEILNDYYYLLLIINIISLLYLINNK
jgi:hypothetical protein